jgi:predicted nucleic acid-binding protein
MFLLDTSVVWAMMSSEVVPGIATWVAQQRSEALFTASICQAEILAGLAIMPAGRRRQALEAARSCHFLEDFEDRVLPFDMHAADFYAELFAVRRRMGRPTTTADLMIASIARSRDASVVTRDTGGFEGCGLMLIDPWKAS